MIKQIMFSLAATAAAVLATTTAMAHDDAHHEKWVVALKADDFDLAETDISDLGVGDAKTVYTEDGRTIDILRTENGVDIYVDGELVDTGLEDGLAPLDGQNVVVTKDVEVICDTGEDCDELVWVTDGDLPDADAPQDQIHEQTVIVIRKKTDSD